MSCKRLNPSHKAIIMKQMWNARQEFIGGMFGLIWAYFDERLISYIFDLLAHPHRENEKERDIPSFRFDLAIVVLAPK